MEVDNEADVFSFGGSGAASAPSVSRVTDCVSVSATRDRRLRAT